MERYSILDPGTPPFRPEEAGIPAAPAQLPPERMNAKSAPARPSTSISAAIAAANAALDAKRGPVLGVKFPGEDGGQSLVDMAERDLDAALQLLANRAQYITGASGAAIALRRSGRTDMLCRASSGSNAPGLGALLSAEAGLSGESVRTRTPLRCDDTERDPRVNRDGCRALGIASVIIMPIESDDQVLGVFELFSGKTNAFGERDMFALQRLAGMVKTAVEVTRPPDTAWLETLAGTQPTAIAEEPAPSSSEEFVLDEDEDEDEDLTLEDLAEQALRASGASSSTREKTSMEAPAGAQQSVFRAVPAEVTAPSREVKAAQPGATSTVAPHAASPVPESPVAEASSAGLAAPAAPPKKALFWSAAASASAPSPERDQSHVPPVLRSLRKCQACNFPVSEGRELCVECEEKKWRGQLRYPATKVPASPSTPPARTAATISSAPALPKTLATAETRSTTPAPGSLPSPVPPVSGTSSSGTSSSGTSSSGKSSSAAPDPSAATVVRPAVSATPPVNAETIARSAYPELPSTAFSVQTAASTQKTALKFVAATSNQSKTPSPDASSSTAELSADSAVKSPNLPDPLSHSESAASPESPIFSAEISSEQSWLARNKFVLGALLAIGGAVAAIVFLR